MPQYIQAYGQTLEFPDGMSTDDIAAAIQKNALSIKPSEPNYGPTGSTGENLLAGIGRGMTSGARAMGTGLRSALGSTSLGPYANDPIVGTKIADALGLPTAADTAEAKRIDAPLMATTSGKVGSGIGLGALSLPAMAAPAGYLGAAAAGGLFGGATTEGDWLDRLKGAGLNAAGAAVGQGVGQGLGWGFGKAADYFSQRAAAQAAANAGKNAAIEGAHDVGYVLPPADANPGIFNSLLQGLSGKIKTAQTASQRNQEVTNSLVKQDLGLPANQPISVGGLKSARQTAANAYDAVGNTGTVTPTQTYSDALDAISAPYIKAAQGFPGAKPNPIIAEMEALKTPQFDASSGLSKVAELRGRADAAYASGDKQTGAALKGAADAIENALETHLTAIGQPAQDMLAAFRSARQTIAKTYTAEKALNPITGDINAQALGQRVLAGKPMSGNMETVGQVAAAFPKAMQSLKEVPNQVSPLDMAVATLGNGALLFARPAARAMILSKPYQSLMAGAPSYGSRVPSLLDSLTNNQYFPALTGAAGMGLLSPANQ